MEGYYDDYTYEDWKDSASVLTKIVDRRRDELEKTNGNKYVYQFMMTPNAGFLNNNKVNIIMLLRFEKNFFSPCRRILSFHFHLIDCQPIFLLFWLT